MGGVHRFGERELASDDRLTDEGLGSLRRGLSGEELAQPVATYDLGFSAPVKHAPGEVYANAPGTQFARTSRRRSSAMCSS